MLIKDLKVRGGKGGKWRPLGHAEKLLASMRKDGLRNPITVTKCGWLISGWHRVEAAKKLGWKMIEVRVVRLEIDEKKKRQWMKDGDVGHSSPTLDIPHGDC